MLIKSQGDSIENLCCNSDSLYLRIGHVLLKAKEAFSFRSVPPSYKKDMETSQKKRSDDLAK